MALSQLYSAAPQLLVGLLLVTVFHHSLQNDQTAPEDQDKEKCSLFPHIVKFTTKDGCKGSVPLFACNGTCRSSSAPKVFYSKPAAESALEHFINKCECCGVGRTRLEPKHMRLHCEHNDSYVNHTQVIPIPETCVCADCLYQTN